MDDIQFNLEGLDSLLGKLEAVQYDVKRKGGRSALRKAAKLVAEKVKAAAARIDDAATRENISKNITIRWSNKTFKRTGDLGFRVGILGGARVPAKRVRKRGTATLDELGEFAGAGSKNPGGDTFHWRFIEFGTQKVAAQPFMRPALASSVDEATNAFIKNYELAIDRALKKAAKKAARGA